MYLISFGKAKLSYKIEAKDLQNIPIKWYEYKPIYKRMLSLAQTEFAYTVQKFRPETEFFITIGNIQYIYNIIMLEDCDTDRVIAIAAQPFGGSGKLEPIQINWYM